MLSPEEADKHRFSEAKFEIALEGWKQGARVLGTETVLFLLALWISFTQGGFDWFFITLTVCAFIIVLRHARNKRITENFEHVMEKGNTTLCRVAFSEDIRTTEPTAFLSNAFTGDPIAKVKLLVHETQIEPLIASSGDRYEFYVKHAYVDNRIYVLISTGGQLICGVSIK